MKNTSVKSVTKKLQLDSIVISELTDGNLKNVVGGDTGKNCDDKNKPTAIAGPAREPGGLQVIKVKAISLSNFNNHQPLKKMDALYFPFLRV